MKALLQLFLTGLLVAATIQRAPGQCLNPYTITTVPPTPAGGGIQLLANQLDVGGNPANNTYANLFGTAGNGLPPLTKVIRWNVNNQDFDPVANKITAGAGWIPSGAATTVLNPGDGVIIFTPSTVGQQSVTFTGTPRATATPVTILPGTYYFLSSQFNCPATYDDIVQDCCGGTAPFEGLALYRLKQSFPFNGDPHNAAFDGPLGWPGAYNIYVYHNGAWTPFPPLVNVGEAVFIGPAISSVAGMAYEDAGSCTVNTPLANWHIHLTGTPTAGGTINDDTFTDQNGNYVFYVPPGTYTVSQIPDACWIPTCPASGSYAGVVVNLGDAITGENFGLKAGPGNHPDLSVQVYATYPIVNGHQRSSPCCGSPMTYHIYYRNGCKKSSTAKLKFTKPWQATYSGFGTLPPGVTGPVPAGFGGTTKTWTIPPLTVGAMGRIDVTVLVNCSASQMPPPLLTAIAVINGGPDINPANNTFTHNVQVTCSFDPNDKQVSPQGCQPGGFVNAQPLTYTVEFQNTGTGPAYNVVVDDVLDPSLDPSTLQVIGASHNYALQLNGQEMIWTFPNILLPAATDDEPGSHGFLTYQVSPLAGLADGTVITNQAGIYFDNNPPIVTATTTNTITSNVEPVASFTVTPRQGSANQTNDFTYMGGTAGATFLWDFGSNAVPATSTDMNPTGVVFQTNGFQSVSLQVFLGDCAAEPATYLLSVGPPTLECSPSDSQIFLSWSGDGYTLQQTPSLGSPISWQSINPSITTIPGLSSTVLDATNVSMFYRLTDNP